MALFNHLFKFWMIHNRCTTRNRNKILQAVMRTEFPTTCIHSFPPKNIEDMARARQGKEPCPLVEVKHLRLRPLGAANSSGFQIGATAEAALSTNQSAKKQASGCVVPLLLCWLAQARSARVPARDRGAIDCYKYSTLLWQIPLQAKRHRNVPNVGRGRFFIGKDG